MDTRQFIADHLHDDVRELALRFHNAKVDMTLALRQIEARQLLSKKLPSWSGNEDLLFPVRLSIEQCSSEATALYKASLLQGRRFADLTGGLGVDCHFIAAHFEEANYVEMNPELCSLARHNFQVLGNSIQVHHCSASEYLERCTSLDCLFLDPARRDTHGNKTVSIADCTPNLLELHDQLLQKAHTVMVKLSPMLDIRQALSELTKVKEIHVVAVENECKELLFVMERDFEGSPQLVGVNLQSGQAPVHFSPEEEREANLSIATKPSNYLYEPNAALMKAGCFRLLSQRYGVEKLSVNSHLYTSEQRVDVFPGRVFEVEGWAPFNKRIGSTLLAGVDKASIATRNFPMSVAELRKRLRLGDGDSVYLFATTLNNGDKVIIRTRKIS